MFFRAVKAILELRVPYMFTRLVISVIFVRSVSMQLIHRGVMMVVVVVGMVVVVVVRESSFETSLFPSWKDSAELKG